MSKTMPTVVKLFAPAILLFACLSFPSVANADEVFISGPTAGCFVAACAPGVVAFTGWVTYSNSTFPGTTAGGFRGIGGAPNPGSNVNTLGSFSLSTAPQTYNTTFTLLVTFVAHHGIIGSNQATFIATLTGAVISDNVGGIMLHFHNTPILFTFNDPNWEALPPGRTVALTGQVIVAQQSAVPEPATMLLLGTGLIGIAAGIRKRLKAK